MSLELFLNKENYNIFIEYNLMYKLYIRQIFVIC